MKSTIVFEHGKTTCASEPGKFCRFFGTMKFGTVPICMLFNDQHLFDDANGWVERCDRCMETFSGGE